MFSIDDFVDEAVVGKFGVIVVGEGDSHGGIIGAAAGGVKWVYPE